MTYQGCFFSVQYLQIKDNKTSPSVSLYTVLCPWVPISHETGEEIILFVYLGEKELKISFSVSFQGFINMLSQQPITNKYSILELLQAFTCIDWNWQRICFLSQVLIPCKALLVNKTCMHFKMWDIIVILIPKENFCVSYLTLFRTWFQVFK